MPIIRDDNKKPLELARHLWKNVVPEMALPLFISKKIHNQPYDFGVCVCVRVTELDVWPLQKKERYDKPMDLGCIRGN